MTKGASRPKEDLKQPLTLGILREELKRFATKDDLKEFVTKKELREELKNYATRDEMAEMFEYQNTMINNLHNELVGWFKHAFGNYEYRISKIEMRFADNKKH